MVVGAGRGPLVDASLKASSRAERQVKVFAVEKNPGAVVTYVGTKIMDINIELVHCQSGRTVYSDSLPPLIYFVSIETAQFEVL